MATQDLATAPTEAVGISEIKKLYPDEWVLIGNPVMDEGFFHVLSGIPIYHSKDKRELAYFGRDKVAAFNRYTVVYTGTFTSLRKLVSLYKPRNP